MNKKLNSHELRDIADSDALEKTKKLKRNPIFLLLENVYDTYNVGGLFRLADALAATKVYLIGDMETPPNHRIAKASIGTYKIVPWIYKKSAKEAFEELKQSYPDIQIIAIEQSDKAQDYKTIRYHMPLAFVVGNETTGVSQDTLKLCDHIAEIPMWGINKSLNVIISAAIVSYEAIRQLKDK